MTHAVSKRLLLSALSLGSLLVMLTPVPGSATDRLYVRMDSVTPCGPVTVEGRQGQFEALTLHEDISSGVDSTGRTGRATLKTFTLGKAIDRCSVPILMKVLRGLVIRETVIDFVRPSDPASVVFASLRLQNFVIVDVKLTASSDSPLELITMVPRVDGGRLTFTVFDPDGGTGAVRACWDFGSNRAC